jgi:hypothetical protein
VLQDTNLRGAKLWRANLAAAQVEGAKLDRADLSRAINVPPDIDLHGACFDSTTIFDGTTPIPPSEVRWCGPPATTLSRIDPRPEREPNSIRGGDPCLR